MFITGARPPRHGSIGSGRVANPATIGLRVRGRQEVNYQPRHLAWTRDASNAELSRSKTTPHCHHDRGERKTGLPTNVRTFELKGRQERSQSSATRLAPKLAQRRCLKLPDPFPSHCKTLADVLESRGITARNKTTVLDEVPYVSILFLTDGACPANSLVPVTPSRYKYL
jgi:hypothetical protein